MQIRISSCQTLGKLILLATAKTKAHQSPVPKKLNFFFPPCKVRSLLLSKSSVREERSKKEQILLKQKGNRSKFQSHVKKMREKKKYIFGFNPQMKSWLMRNMKVSNTIVKESSTLQQARLQPSTRRSGTLLQLFCSRCLQSGNLYASYFLICLLIF